MTTDDLLLALVIADDQERDKLLLDPRLFDKLSARLGQQAFQELKMLAERRQQLRDSGHIGSNDPPNLIFIPGVMGSLLHAKIGAGVWWIDAVRARDKIDLLGLDPNGGDPADEKQHVEPFCLDLSYEGFLFAAYDAKGFRPIKHPYDWRKSLRKSTDSLAKHIEDVWQMNGNRPVHLVAHSMGGLLVRTTLMQHHSRIRDKIGRVVFLGTPHYGSPAIAYYLRKHLRGSPVMWLMGRFLSPTTFRTLWGPLGLIPAPHGIYPDTRTGATNHPCVNFDPYKADDWELGLTPPQKSDLQRILDHAAALYRDLFIFHGNMDAQLRKRMAVVAGVGYETPFRVEIHPGLARGTRTKLLVDRDEQDVHREGDGSVPIPSSTLEGVAEVRFIKAEHSALPNIPAVCADVFRFLNNEPMKLPSTPIGALEGHMSVARTTSIIPSLEGNSNTQTNRWRIPEPLPHEWVKLETELEAGMLPDFERVRLL